MTTDRQLEAIRDLVRISRQPGASSARRVARCMRSCGYTNAEILEAAQALTVERNEKAAKVAARKP